MASTTEAEITSKFWKSLRSDMTVMLGLTGNDDGHFQPMTAQIEKDADRGPLWIFTAKDVHLVQAMAGKSSAAAAQFVSKGHDLFASVQGAVSLVDDPAMVDRLWNRFIAAWYPGGKEDPSLQLLRFDLTHAHIWLNEHSVLAGIKIMLGRDPKKDYEGKVVDMVLP
jgi:general stress protein 26